MKTTITGLTLSLLICLAALSLSVTSCTQNARSKAFGGTMNITLPAGQKLINATWKEAQLWYLYRPMKLGETNETYTFQEKSSFGMLEGKVIFNEIIK